MNLPYQKLLLATIKAVALVLLASPTVLGQEPPVVTQPSAPPPVRIITKEDKARIEASKDEKSRLRTIIELADGHLSQAEAQTAQEEYDIASAALGKYRALIEEALHVMSQLSPDQNKTRDLYKKLELILRAHGPRLTAIRRTTPLEYAVWVKDLEEFAREGRTHALNSFYGTTVVKDPQSRLDNKQKAKDSTPPRDNKPQ